MADKQIRAHERRVQRRADIEKRPRRRYILPNTWVFISSRTRGGQFLFSEFDEADHALVAGLYIVAMKRYGVQVAAHVMMSGHIHAMMRARRGKRISLAMQYVKAGIARLVHRKHGTKGAVWDGPFHHQNCLDPEAELDRFKYLISHGNKEGFVSGPADWDLPNCVDALTGDGVLRGEAWDKAAQRRRRISALLTPLTAWMKRPRAEWRQFVTGLVAELVAESVEARERAGLPPLPVGERRPDGTRARPRLARPRDFRHVPDTLKVSRNRVFVAKGAQAERLVADAYSARRLNVDAALVAAEVLVLEGGGVDVPLPEPCQWPPFPTEAMGDESWVEMSFAEVFSSPAAPGPELTATA